MGEFSLTDLPGGWTVGRFAPLDRLPGIRHFITTRKALDVNLIAADRPGAAVALSEALGVREAAFLDQVHGDVVIEVSAGGFAGKGDGLITNVPGLGLMGVSADCPLVLAADLDGKAVGVAHASWRGTVKQIAFKLARRLAERYQIDPSRLVACICPSAGPERYEVGQDVVEAALAGLGPSAREFFRQRDGKTYLDLWAANRAQLLAAGLREENVHVAGVCTITRNDLFPSYRVEGVKAGRFAAVIAKKE
jgi:YfiH family protein